MRRLILPGLVSLGLLAVACGDDDDGGGNNNTAGTAGRGGSAGSGGSTAQTGGSGGSTAATGGTGVAGDAGAAGEAGSAGAGGAPTKKIWEPLVIGEPLSATEDDRIAGVTFHNDKVYAVGYIGAKSDAGDNRKVAVARYGTDGKLDKGWASNGIFTLDLSDYEGLPDDPNTEGNQADATAEQGHDVVVQADGSVVVLARAETIDFEPLDRTTPTDLIVFRLSPTGELDKNFGDPNATGKLDGLAVISFGDVLEKTEGEEVTKYPDDSAYALDIDAEGRLYVFGTGVAPAASGRLDVDRYVVRLSKDGELDDAFGTDGFASFDVPQGSLTPTTSTPNPPTLKLNDNIRHGFVLSDGSIISSGYTNVAGRNQVVLAKFTNEGKLDPSFSGDGVVRLAPFAEGMAEAYGVAIQSNGNFVTTGYGRVSLDSAARPDVDLVSFRVNNKGEFDPAWGVAGAFVHDVGASEDRGRYTLALPDDRVLMVGATSPTAGNKDAMVLLLEKDGLPAENFDAAGFKSHDFTGNDEFFAAALSKDGKWVALGGYAATGNARPLTNGDATFAILPVGE